MDKTDNWEKDVDDLVIVGSSVLKHSPKANGGPKCEVESVTTDDSNRAVNTEFDQWQPHPLNRGVLVPSIEVVESAEGNPLL